MGKTGRLFDKSGLKSLRSWTQKRIGRKLDSVAGQDATVEVTDGRKIRARISEESDNLLRKKTGLNRGLYVPGSAEIGRAHV